jgi:hypothetical protein
MYFSIPKLENSSRFPTLRVNEKAVVIAVEEILADA